MAAAGGGPSNTETLCPQFQTRQMATGQKRRRKRTAHITSARHLGFCLPSLLPPYFGPPKSLRWFANTSTSLVFSPLPFLRLPAEARDVGGFGMNT